MRKSFILVIFVLIYFFFKPTSVLAKIVPPGSIFAGYDFTISTPKYLPPGSDTKGDACPVSCDVPQECANSENLNNCGLATCQGGNAWTKYTFQNCVITFTDTEAKTGICEPRYTQGDVVYSIGDKCFVPEPGLHSSSCFGQPSPQQYKTCCSSGTPSFVNPGSCEPFAGDTTNPPWEGRCPAGYQREVFCGDDGQPPCGQAACGPVGPVCGNDICEAGEDVSSCRSDCLDPSFLDTFSGSCSGTAYTASLSWSCSGNCAPLPSTDSGCSNGFWVDIDDNSSFFSYSNKCVTGTSTSAPSGFGGPGGAFTFQKGTTYYARVYNGQHSNTVSLAVPNTACDSGPPTCESFTLNGKNCRNLAASAICETTTQGNSVNIAVTTKDDVQVSIIQLFKNTEAIQTFNNTSAVNPYGIIYGWDTSSVAAGTYTMIANSSDTSNNSMLGNDQNCKGSLKIDSASIPLTVTCSANPNSANSGTEVTWTARVVQGGVPPFTYIWSGTDSLQGKTGNPAVVSYTTAGNKTGSVRVTDSTGAQSPLTACTNSVTITAFSYNLTNGGDRNVTQGASTTNTITANLGSGTTQLVKLSVSGCPSGVTCSLSPTSGNPTYSSTLTMTASSTATTGTFLITVTGTSSGLSNRTSTFNLTVNAASAPPAPTVSTSSLSCINPGYTGSGVTISWINSRVTWVNIDSNFGFSTPYYQKAVSGVLSTTGPSGFNANNGSGALSLNPSTTYYARTYNGAQNSGVTSFSIPACVAACTPETNSAFCSRLGKNCGSVTGTDNCGTSKTVSCGTFCPSGQTCGGGGTPNVCGSSSSSSSPWIQTTGGDVHSNDNISTPGGP